MNNQEILIDKFDTVSFFENTSDNNQKVKPNFIEKFFQENALVYYYVIIAISEYFILSQLMNCYTSNQNTNFRYFLFFLARTVSFIGLTETIFSGPQEFLKEITSFKENLKETNIKLQLAFHLLIWLIFWNLQDYFLITNLLILYKSKIVYQISIQIVKGYPLKNDQYKFMMIFGVYLICNLIHNSLQAFHIVLLLFSGFLFYINDDFQTLYSNPIQQNFTRHIAFALLTILFFLIFLFGDKSEIFNFQNLFFFLMTALVSFVNTYVIIRLKITSDSGQHQNYSQNLILYIVLLSFILDCFFNSNKRTSWVQYLITMIGVGAIIYVNKETFSQMIINQKKGKFKIIDNQFLITNINSLKTFFY